MSAAWATAAVEQSQPVEIVMLGAFRPRCSETCPPPAPVKMAMPMYGLMASMPFSLYTSYSCAPNSSPRGPSPWKRRCGGDSPCSRSRPGSPAAPNGRKPRSQIARSRSMRLASLRPSHSSGLKVFDFGGDLPRAIGIHKNGRAIHSRYACHNVLPEGFNTAANWAYYADPSYDHPSLLHKLHAPPAFPRTKTYTRRQQPTLPASRQGSPMPADYTKTMGLVKT